MNLNQLFFKPFILVLVMPTAWMAPALADNAPVQENLPKILSQRTTEDREYLPDFSYAGYRNGAEELPVASGKVILVDEFGAQADDEADDTKAIISAIAKANETRGPVIVRFVYGLLQSSKQFT